jgi:SRSO17 transposase
MLSWTDDPPRCRAARVPEQVGFRTKPELARVMLEGALDAGVPAAWVTADEVYGGSPTLRQWLEERGVWHVLAVKCTELLAVQAPDGPAGARTSAAQLAAAVPATVDRLQRWPRRQGPPPVRLDPSRACRPGHRWHGEVAAGAP